VAVDEKEEGRSPMNRIARALCAAAAISFGAHTSLAAQSSKAGNSNQPEWTFSQDDPEHGERTCAASVSSATYEVSLYGTVAGSLALTVEKYAEDSAEKTFRVDDGFSYTLAALDDEVEVKGVYVQFPTDLIYDIMDGKQLVLSAVDRGEMPVSLKGSQSALRSFLTCFMGLEKWDDLAQRRISVTRNVSARLTGTCNKLIVAGRNRTGDCAANRGAALEQNKQNGFSVIVVYDNPKTMLSFEGHAAQIRPDGETQYQPVSTVRKTGAHGEREMTMTVGACAIPMDTYRSGIATIRCSAIDGEGQEYEFEYEKNVMPAEIAVE
jgi:hypothetical protein